MSDGNSTVRDVAETVKGVVEAIPVYQDLLQPAVQEVGKGLQTVAKLTHVALAPISALVWGYEQFQDFISTRLAEKLAGTPPDQIVTPKAFIAGPVFEALRWTGNEEALREMYANLLATSMDERTASNAHPGFVEVIKQMTPDEAKLIAHIPKLDRRPVVTITADNKEPGKGGTPILVNYSTLGSSAQCEHIHLTPQYLDNFIRLGLIRIPDDMSYTADDAYSEIENSPVIKSVKAELDALEGKKFGMTKKIVEITQFGNQFIGSCVETGDMGLKIIVREPGAGE